MLDIMSGNNQIIYIIIFLVPGYIMNSVVNKVIPRDARSATDTTLQYITFTLLYCLLFINLLSNMVESILYIDSFEIWVYLGIILILVINPIVIGIITGLTYEFRIVEHLLIFVGLRPMSPYPSAWDYKFHCIKKYSWLIITFINDTEMRAYFSGESSAGSTINELDIYVEKVYDFVDDDWILRKGTDGMWIPKSSILHIEYIDTDEPESSPKGNISNLPLDENRLVYFIMSECLLSS